MTTAEKDVIFEVTKRAQESKVLAYKAVQSEEYSDRAFDEYMLRREVYYSYLHLIEDLGLIVEYAAWSDEADIRNAEMDRVIES